MKIIVRNPLPWGNYATQVIEISNDMQIKEFKKLVCDRFKLSPSKTLIKLEREDFIVIEGGKIYLITHDFSTLLRKYIKFFNINHIMEIKFL